MNEYTSIITAIIANVLVKIFCFYLGYLIVKLGYNLMKEGIRGEFKFFAEFTKLKGGLISASPGLLFLLLGVILIGYAMSIKKEVTLDTYIDYNKKEGKRELPHDKNKTIIIDSLKN